MEDKLTIIVCLVLAVFRVYLELIKFDFASLPLTKGLMAKENGQKFHRFGLFICIGYILLFAPPLLFS